MRTNSNSGGSAICCKVLLLLIIRIVGALGSIAFHELTFPSFTRRLRQWTSANPNDLSDSDKSSYQTQQDSSDDLLKYNQLIDKKE